MKVAIIHYAEPVSRDKGFVLTRYASVAQELISNGHQVTRYFPSFDHRAREFRDFGSYTDNFGKHFVIQTSGYKESRGFARLKFLYSFKSKLLRNQLLNKIDIFIVGCPMPGISSALRRKYPNSIIITDVRDFWPDVQISSAKGLKKYVFEVIGKYFSENTINDIKSSNYTVTLSKSYADRIKQKCNIAYEPLVVPLGSATFSSDLFCENDLNQRSGVIFVGSLSKLFDFNRLLDIWQLFCSKSPELAKSNPLKIVGHGSEFDFLKNRVKKLKYVELLGFVPQKEAIELMCSSKLAIAIYNQMELHTLPNKLFEYSATGLPIISNWAGDVNDVTKSYCFTYGDSASTDEMLADFICKIIGSPSILQSASIGARNFSTDYSRSKLAREFNSLISKLSK